MVVLAGAAEEGAALAAADGACVGADVGAEVAADEGAEVGDDAEVAEPAAADVGVEDLLLLPPHAAAMSATAAMAPSVGSARVSRRRC